MTSPTDARRFFEEQILEQATHEGVLLTSDERLMLKWSEAGPDVFVDPTLAERLAVDTSDADYEDKIAGLLRRKYSAQIARDSTARREWSEAFRALGSGDYYLLVILRRALGRQLTPWWKFAAYAASPPDSQIDRSVSFLQICWMALVFGTLVFALDWSGFNSRHPDLFSPKPLRAVWRHWLFEIGFAFAIVQLGLLLDSARPPLGAKPRSVRVLRWFLLCVLIVIVGVLLAWGLLLSM
jgi:hypothetical protein